MSRPRLPERMPSKWPWRSLLALVAGLVLLVCGSWWRAYNTWSVLEKHYFWDYVRASLVPWGALDQDMFYVTDKPGRGRRAIAADLGDARLERLMQEGVLRYELRLERRQSRAGLAAWWRANIYGGQTWSEKLIDAGDRWWASAALVVGLLVFAAPKDRAGMRKRREGWLIRGPEFVTSQEFTELTIPRGAAEGIGLVNHHEQAGGKGEVHIAREREPMHLLIVGDTGSGKSTLIKRFLAQIADRGEAAIVYDPACEFTKAFYSAEHGDLVLNPRDARMPYWSPSEEIVHDAEALAVAASLVKDQSRENPFFVEGPRRLLAQLLTFRPTTEELLSWFRNPAEIEKRLRGTELASLIEPSAHQQRAGILSTLGLSLDALRQLPQRQDTSSTWSAVEWAKHRQGWIFLTSESTVREAVNLLHTHWLDMLILRLMNSPSSAGRRVWFILDELASLNKIPQLHTALTENRKSGNPVVIGFHGRSQLEARYGRDAEVMMSQPFTKIFLRTTEPEAAEWISRAIGDQEIDRERQSHTQGEFPNRRSSRGTQIERVIKRAVLASEIAGLGVGRGYLKQENYVVKLLVPPRDLEPKAPGFIERPTRPGPVQSRVGGGAPVPPPIFE